MSNAENETGPVTETTYSLSDNVWRRVVQIVQEAMMTGIDCVDLLRQIRVQDSHPGEDSAGLVREMELTTDYREQVQAGYERMTAEAEKLAEQLQAQRIIGNG